MGFSRSGWSAKSRICAKTSETVQREISLFFHFVGIGLFFTILVAGTILEFQYRKTQSLEARETLLRALKPIGLLSPVATLIMLGSGIGNMTALGAGIFSMGWLTAKIFFFALVVVSGLLFGIKSRKRGAIVRSMVRGEAPENTGERLQEYNKQLAMSYVAMMILLVIILGLSVYGRAGGR